MLAGLVVCVWVSVCMKLTHALRDNEPSYTTLSGNVTLQGTLTDEVASYKGIRYAMPPVEMLRWKPPVLYTYSTDTDGDTVDTTTYQPHCIQTEWPNGSEDCLYLNIFLKDPSLNLLESSLPVVIFIHGGSYINGAAKFYSGEDMVRYWNGNAIVVTIDYRLNVFGFLGSNELKLRDAAAHSTGNYGLQDQRMAFEWIRQNIAAFGGDPERVTIMGESAGAGSVTNHLTMPKSWEYFTAAIIESGSFAHWTTQSMDRAEEMYQGLLMALECKDVDCLLTKSADELLHASVPYSDSNFYVSPYVPTADGVEATTHPWIAASNGAVADVPILHGTNNDEGLLFTALDQRYRVNMSELIEYWTVEMQYTDKEIVQLLNLYVVGHSEDYPSTGHDNITTTEWWALERSTGDDMFSCSAKYLSQQLTNSKQSSQRKSNVFMYHFEYASMMSSYTLHGSEMAYVFHWPIGTYSNEELSDVMSSYWGNFVIDPKHNPNSGFIGMDTLPVWSPYDYSRDNVLIIDTLENIHEESNLKFEECNFHISRHDAAIREEFS